MIFSFKQNTMFTQKPFFQIDFIEMSEHHSATGRLNWTERKPKMMKNKKWFVFNWTSYYFEIFIVVSVCL